MADDKQRGLYEKYDVRRRDGREAGPCLVLELDDPNSWHAVQAWARTVRDAGYSALALDVELLLLRHLKSCDWYYGSHGCDLPLGHPGDVHVCTPDGQELYVGPWAGPWPDEGWSRSNACHVWPKGDPDEFQQPEAHGG